MANFNRKEYMKVYNKEWYSKRKPPTSRINDYIDNPYIYHDLIIQPTLINFKGTDKDEPIVCSHFGCNVRLSAEQQLYGSTCINHQQKIKIDVAMHISHPIKKTA